MASSARGPLVPEAGPWTAPFPDARRLLAASSFFVGDADRIRALAQQFKDRRHVLESEVRGFSMRGALPNCCRIRIECRHGDTAAPGQVVAALVGDKIVVHRVAYIGRFARARGFLVTRGDSTAFPDLPIDVASILGEVIAVETAAGWRTPPASAAPVGRPWLARLLIGAMAGCLEIHPRLARGLGGALWRCKLRYNRGKRLLQGAADAAPR
ncbi:MAG TPA: S24/S26 family peptidase [Stellaceae bacterium]|nr:S24/S26 family peptidase [Stellaceae bacterium]